MSVWQAKNSVVVVVSIIIAMVLAILPLPQSAIWLRPEWVLLVVIYWTVCYPEQFGIITAWFIGLLLDIITGTVLGEHALAVTAVSYIVNKFSLWLRLLVMPQQMIVICLLAVLYQVLIFWIQGLLNEAPTSLFYWSSSLISAIVWPWLYLLLKDCEQRFLSDLSF